MPLNEIAAWIIAYDIAEPRRLARVCKAVLKTAAPVQYSLYMALATQNEMNALAMELSAIIHHAQDDVRIYRIPNAPEFYTIGVQRCPLPLILPTTFPPALRRFVHTVFSPRPDSQSALSEISPPHRDLDFLARVSPSYLKEEC